MENTMGKAFCFAFAKYKGREKMVCGWVLAMIITKALPRYQQNTHTQTHTLLPEVLALH